MRKDANLSFYMQVFFLSCSVDTICAELERSSCSAGRIQIVLNVEISILPNLNVIVPKLLQRRACEITEDQQVSVFNQLR